MRLIDKDEAIKNLKSGAIGKMVADKYNMDGWLEWCEEVPAIPLDWIHGYIETCDMFQMRVNVPASKIISVMVNTWKQENPGAKRGEPDGNN